MRTPRAAAIANTDAVTRGTSPVVTPAPRYLNTSSRPTYNAETPALAGASVARPE